MDIREHKKNIRLIFLSLFVFLLIGVVLIRVILRAFDISVNDIALVINLVAYYAICMPIFMAMTKHIGTGKADIEAGGSMNNAELFKWICIAMGVVYVSNFISLSVVEIVNSIKNVQKESSDIMNILKSTSLEMQLILIGITAPILEEFFFRRFLYSKLSMYGDKIYILMSATCFSLTHLRLEQFLYTFLTGAVLAYTYAKHRKLLYVTIMHIFINSSSVITQLALGNRIMLSVWASALFAMAIYGIVSLIKLLLKRQLVFNAPKYDLDGTSAFKLVYTSLGFWVLLTGAIVYSLLINYGIIK